MEPPGKPWCFVTLLAHTVQVQCRLVLTLRVQKALQRAVPRPLLCPAAEKCRTDLPFGSPSRPN